MNVSNPFLWTGPEFLGFYTVFGLLVIVGFRGWLHVRNRPTAESQQGKSPLVDPYAIAFLRSGPGETLRTAVFSLLTRGALKVSGKNLRRTKDHEAFGMRPLEKEVMGKFETPRSVEGLQWDTQWLMRATAPYDKQLRDAGMLNRTGALERRVYWLLVLLLLGVAAIKVVYALDHGHKNVLFLIGLALISWIVLKPLKRRLTPLGKRTLEQQQVLFQGVRQGRRNTGADDATWAAAVFGVGALSVITFPAVAHMMTPVRVPGAGAHSSGSSGESSSSSSSNSCSSSSDSSSSDSGSSGCGGCGSGGGD